MSATIDEARSLIEEGIARIDAERESLEAAIKELGGTNGQRRPGRPAGSGSEAQAGRRTRTPKARKGGQRRIAKRGQRRDELIALLKKNKKGLTVAAAAKALDDVSPSQLYQVAKAAEKEGSLKKEGAVYVITGIEPGQG